MSKTLTPMQQRLRDLFKKPNTDVHITHMYHAVFDPPHVSDIVEMPITFVSVRDMQQKLGPVIQRVNAKLDGQRIEPGLLKRTYRLNTNPTA